MRRRGNSRDNSLDGSIKLIGQDLQVVHDLREIIKWGNQSLVPQQRAPATNLLSIGVTLKSSAKVLQMLHKLQATASLVTGKSGVSEEVSSALGTTLSTAATKNGKLQGDSLFIK